MTHNVASAITFWDNSGIVVYKKSNTFKLLDTLMTEPDRIEATYKNIREQHHVNTAIGKNLDRMGDLVQLDRKVGESDERYRTRLKLAFRVSNIGTTFDEVIEFMAAMLSTDVQNIELDPRLAADPATVYVSADASLFDASPLTRAEISEFGNDVVMAGHEVKVEERGTFRLKADGDTDDPAKGLTSDSISTGGTLSQDIL